MRRILFTIIFMSGLIFIQHPPKAFALSDAILAIVNDEVITLQDLQAYVHSSYVSFVAEGRSQKELQDIASDLQANGLTKLIEEKLMLSKANAMGMSIRDKLVDDKIEEIKKRYPSEEEFLKDLIDNGATVSDLKGKILNQLKIKYLIEHEVKDKIFINPQEVTDYYAKHKDLFRQNERISLGSIFVSFAQDKIAAKEKIQKALDQITQGTSFDETAKQYSESPAIGVVERGQLLPEIDKVVFSMSTGEVTPVIETPNGFYIFKVLGKIKESLLPLQDVKESITNRLYNQKFQKRFSEWLDQLKKNAYIEIKQ